MAPIQETPESFFLAPLDKCLEEGHSLISWKSAYDALSDVKVAQNSSNLEWFFSDSLTIAQLSSDFEPIQSATPQSKADFETRTSSINVTASVNGKYDIKQIKEDATWLSKEAEIDEVTALRIVVLEWQTRPAVRIMRGYTEEEMISLQGAVKSTDLSASFFPRGDAFLGAQAGDSGFLSDEARHARLLRILLSEREHILAISFLFAASTLEDPPAPIDRTFGEPTNVPAPISWLGNAVKKTQHARVMRKEKSSEQTNEAIKALEKRLHSLETGRGLTSVIQLDSELELTFRVNQVVEIIRIMEILFIRISLAERHMPAQSVQSWFTFAHKYSFFDGIQIPYAHQQLIRFQAMICLVSLHILKLPYVIDSLYQSSGNDKSQIPALDQSWRESISGLLLTEEALPSPTASLARFAWSTILRAVDLVSDAEKTPSDEHRAISPQLTREDDLQKESAESNSLALRFATSAIDESHAFQVIVQLALMLPSLFDMQWEWRPQLHARIAICEILRQGLRYTQYSEELIQACIATIRCDTEPTVSLEARKSSAELSVRMIQIFNSDKVLHEGFLKQAEMRYPHESAPLIRICEALTPVYHLCSAGNLPDLPLLGMTKTFAEILPVGFNEYDLPDDDDSTLIRLTQNLPLFSRKDKKPLVSDSTTEQDKAPPELLIQNGTYGRIASDTKPSLVMWAHHFSISKYISLLLATMTSLNPLEPVLNNGTLEIDMQSDNIDFITTICSRAPTVARTTLEEASDGLGRNQDIITVITDIFEAELSNFTNQRRQGQIDLLSSCLRFFTAVMHCTPNRIWPIFARSSFLGMDGRGSRMATLALATDVESGRQQFAHDCLSLLDAMVTDTLSHTLSRNSPSVRSTTRFQDTPDFSTGLSPKVMDKIVLAFTQQCTVFLQTSISESQKFGLVVQTLVIEIFNRLIVCVYGFDDSKKPQEKLTSVLATAANFVLDEFLTSSGNILTISLVSSGSHLRPSPGVSIRSSLPRSHHVFIRANISLLTNLLRISVILDTPSSRLLQQLFDILPFLIRLYAYEDAHKKSIINMLSALLISAAIGTDEPASLLGNVASQTGKDFLNMLQNSNHALNDVTLEQDIWELLTTAMDSKQQSFATFVILGDIPKRPLKQSHTKVEEPAKRSLLAVALDTLSRESIYAEHHVVSILKFVGAAQNYWPWVSITIRKHSKFLVQIANFLTKIGEHVSTSESDQAHVLYVASLILDISSVYLHNMRQLRDTSFIKTLGPKLTYLRDHGVDIPRYNSSLHANLKRNLEKKFPGCSPSSFKRVLNRPTFGDDFFYDTAFAGEILGSDQAWKEGFAKELLRANLNLSLVEAQIRLMGSWKSLAMELSASISAEKGVQATMTKSVLECLKANADSRGSEPFLSGLRESRAEFAFALSQRLVKVSTNTQETRSILAATWNSIMVLNPDFDTLLVGSGASYHRSLLRTLLLALQPHASDDDSSNGQGNLEALVAKSSAKSGAFNRGGQTDVLSILCQIAAEVIGRGFRSLAIEAHNNPSNVIPSDFALLTSILQGVLRVRSVNFIYSEIMLRLCESGVHRYALALFSWSNRLLGPDNDPVIGDLSISFLRELSTIPPMAEYLATEGVLNQLSTAPLLGYLRQPSSGFGPLDQPYRLHSIWARGIIPLTLNVLMGVGDSFAAEATAFLATFSHQLSRITTAFGPKATGTGNVTLDDAIEIHTLALTVGVLDSYRGSAVAISVNGGTIPGLDCNWAALREDLDVWFNGRGSTSKGRIVPRGEIEAALARAKPEGRVQEAANKLEEMVLVELQGALMCLGGNGALINT